MGFFVLLTFLLLMLGSETVVTLLGVLARLFMVLLEKEATNSDDSGPELYLGSSGLYNKSSSSISSVPMRNDH